MKNLPELPLTFESAFQAAKAKAELEYATRADSFPRHPHLASAVDVLHVPILIQKVFFAYCTQARNACREGAWSITQVSQAIDAAWPLICDSFFVRERGPSSEVHKLDFRVAAWRTVTDSSQWKQHLRELDALAHRGAGAVPVASVEKEAAEVAEPGTETRAEVGRDPTSSGIETVRASLPVEQIRKFPPSRHEVEKFANDALAVERDRINAEYAEKLNQALGQVKLTGNSGGYLPALVKCATEHLRDMILSWADARVDAFTRYELPCDARAEKDIEISARQTAGGCASRIRGRLDRMSKQTRRHVNDGAGHIEREIGIAMNSAVREAKLRFARQRIKYKDAGIVQLAALPTASPQAPLGSMIEQGKPVVAAELGVAVPVHGPVQESPDTVAGANGLEAAQAGPSARLRRGSGSLTKHYEDRCPLVGWQSLDALNQRGEQRETELSRRIEAAATRLRARRQEVEQVKSKRQRKAANKILQQEAATLRQDIVELAAKLASEGVQEFADGLLLAQKRLGVHANLLREYTACLVREIRNKLDTSDVFRTDPLLPWQQDPIAQKAIPTCEEILRGRWTIGDGRPYGGAKGLSGNNPTWASIVQDWEAFKDVAKIEPLSRGRVPESALRTILSKQYGVKPDDVTQEQIGQAGTDLCLHYGSVLVIPLDVEAGDPPKPEPESIGTPHFWKERENEFRKHDSPENRMLWAQWSSLGDHWSFSAGSGLESPAPGSVQVFKALAREAAKGLAGSRSDDPCEDWLDALRRKTDKSTGRRLYPSCPTTGTTAIGKTWLERMGKFGEPVPAGSMIEFVPIESKTTGTPAKTEVAEQKLFWDVTTEKIENLFTSSANLCLELRSLVRHPGQVVRGEVKVQATASEGIAERSTVAPIAQPPANMSVSSDEAEPVRTERASLLISYKAKGRGKGIRITDEMVAKAANPGKWNDRTMVTWWKRNDPRCKLPLARKIMFVLDKDPASIWPPTLRNAK